MFNSRSYIHIEAKMETKDAHHVRWGGERRGQACRQRTPSDRMLPAIAWWGGGPGAQEVFLQRPVSPARWELRQEEGTLAGHTETALEKPGVSRKGWAQSWADVGHRRRSTTRAWKMSGMTIILVLAGLGGKHPAGFLCPISKTYSLTWGLCRSYRVTSRPKGGLGDWGLAMVEDWANRARDLRGGWGQPVSGPSSVPHSSHRCLARRPLGSLRPDSAHRWTAILLNASYYHLYYCDDYQNPNHRLCPLISLGLCVDSLPVATGYVRVPRPS